MSATSGGIIMSKSKLSLGIYSIPPPLVSPWYILPPPGK